MLTRRVIMNLSAVGLVWPSSAVKREVFGRWRMKTAPEAAARHNARLRGHPEGLTSTLPVYEEGTRAFPLPFPRLSGD
jgi:hypothetical protein